ncbi:MAG: fibronectin type III domain-containing protein [Gammaproteobacteria bacterium]
MKAAGVAAHASFTAANSYKIRVLYANFPKPATLTVTLSPRPTGVRARWTALADLSVTNYQVRWRTASGPGKWQGGVFTAASATLVPPNMLSTTDTDGVDVGDRSSVRINGLTDGVSYEVQVRAKTDSSTGNWSLIKSATPAAAAIPGAPTFPTATAGERQIVVGWFPPASDGGEDITSYRVRWRLTDADGAGGSSDAGAWRNASGDDADCGAAPAACGEEVSGGGAARAYTITGANKNVQYDVAVLAINSIGAGPWTRGSDARATPVAATDATLSSLSFSGGSLSPTFAPTIESYTLAVPNITVSITPTVSLSQANASFTLIAETVTIPFVTLTLIPIGEGLSKTVQFAVTADDGTTTKTYTVVATRAAGLSEVPTGLTVTPANEALLVDWVPPANSHGPILGYRVRWSSKMFSGWDSRSTANGAETNSTDATWTITGLGNGTAYSVAVAAVTSAGIGAWPPIEKANSRLVRPYTPSADLPNEAPANLRATTGSSNLVLAWDAVNGATGYKARYKLAGEAAYSASVSVTVLTHTFSGLALGAHDVQVAAANASGQGIWATGIFSTSNDSVALLDVLRIAVGGSDLTLTKTNAQGAPLTENAEGFASEHERYSVSVANTVASAMLTAEPRSAAATFRIRNGSNVISATRGQPTEFSIALGTNSLRIEITSKNRASTKTYLVQIIRATLPLAFAAEQADARFHVTGSALTPIVLPEVTGGLPPWNYALSGDTLPGDLAFTAATRSIAGTLTGISAVTTANVILTVTDSNIPAASATQNFNISVAPPLAFATAPGSLTFTFNTAGTETLPEVSGGFTPVVLTLEGDTLPGLAFTAGTRALAGTPTETGRFAVTYKATDAAGANGISTGVLSANIGLKIVAATAAAPANLAVSPTHRALRLTWTAPSGTAAGGEPPSGYRARWKESGGSAWTNSGGTAGIDTNSPQPSYEIPNLTNGTTYMAQVAAVNSAGTGAWSASVESAPIRRMSFNSQQINLVFLTGKALPAPVVLPAAARGTTPYVYSVTGLPAGLNFAAATREISGTPGGTGAVEITYMVSDSATPTAATDMQTFTINQVTFDLDLDAANDATDAAASVQDGIITARYLLGVRGAALVRGQTNSSAGALEPELKNGADSKALDVDGDGDADGTDGILIARYLFGLRGNDLIKGFPGITADNIAAIVANISGLLPGQ